MATLHPLNAVDSTYTTYFSHLNDRQQLAVQFALRSSALLSILGSGYISYHLLGPRRQVELLKRVFSRLLLGLSLSDVGSSACLFLGTWPIPPHSLHADIAYGARGSQVACTTQGFFLQIFYYSSIFYTAAMSVNFLLSVKYQWTEEVLRKRVEPLFHIISWGIPLCTSILVLQYDMINPTGYFCYVTTYPIACDAFPDTDCIRGSRNWMWRCLVQIIPFFLCFVTILYSMKEIYQSVREQENALNRYSNEFLEREAKASIKTFRKATQYIGIFMAVWIPVLIVVFMFELGLEIPFGIIFVAGIAIPAVGYLNAMAYSGVLVPALTKGWSFISKCLRSVCPSCGSAKESEEPKPSPPEEPVNDTAVSCDPSGSAKLTPTLDNETSS